MSALTLFATAEVPEQAAWIDLAQLGALATFAIYGWTTILGRRSQGLAVLPETPHRFVPWDGGLALMTALIYLAFAQFGTGLLAGVFYKWDDPQRTLPERGADALADPQWMIATFQAQSLMSYVAVAASFVFLTWTAKARIDDLGLSLTDWRRYTKIGIVAFAVIVPPVLLLQGVLNVVWMKSQHPIILAYRASGNAALFLWCSVAAVLTAPFVEEFLFRGVLQGWFERMIAQREEIAAKDSTANEVLPLDERPRNPSFMPTVLSSVLFALVHVGAGPDFVPIFFLALGLGYLYRQTHSIWPGFIVHTLLNAWSMVALVFMP